MRITICLLVLLVHPLFGANEPPVVPPRDASWQLVWSDEFNGNGPPDPSVWQFEEGFARNQELQWYQPANAFCRDGLLVFEARREQVKNPNYKKKRSVVEAFPASCGIHLGLDHHAEESRMEIRAI